MATRNLFEPSLDEPSGLAPVQAKARSTDPVASHIAASKVTRSGAAKSDREAILRALRAHQNSTAGEIANYCGWGTDNPRVSRRLPELEKARLVKRGPDRLCKIKKNEMATWSTR